MAGITFIETLGKELPDMTEKEKTYLMGFLEGFAARIGNQQNAEAAQPGGQS